MSAITACRVALALLLLFAPTVARADVFYANDFDGHEHFGPGILGGFSGVGAVEPVQGYATLAPAFWGSFLRSYDPGNPAPAAVLTLTGLPASSPAVVRFSLAIIDSWDGTSFPPDVTQDPDFFNVRMNGVLAFSETFTNFSYLGATQSYAGPALALEQPLGFETGQYRYDSAYELIVVGTADGNGDLVVEFFASGDGWHAPSTAGPEEESWAIDNVAVAASTTATPDGSPSTGLALLPLRPSPSHGVTHLAYEIPTDGAVHLQVFDSLGRRVRTLLEGERQPAGTYRREWDGRNDVGTLVPAGVYHVRLVTREGTRARKIILLR